MPVTGSGTEGLRQTVAAIGRIAAGKHRKQLAESLGAEALALIKRGFQLSQAPDGTKWARPKLRDGMPLLDTSRLRNAFMPSITEARVEIVNPTIYANLMNYGGTIVPKQAKALRFMGRGKTFFSKKVVIPARQMVPGDALPEAWSNRLVAVADKVMHLAVKAA